MKYVAVLKIKYECDSDYMAKQLLTNIISTEFVNSKVGLISLHEETESTVRYIEKNFK